MSLVYLTSQWMLQKSTIVYHGMLVVRRHMVVMTAEGVCLACNA